MRLYGSQSRISKSAIRRARVHRPVVAFDAPAIHRSTPVTPRRDEVTSKSPTTVLVPRSV